MGTAIMKDTAYVSVPEERVTDHLHFLMWGTASEARTTAKGVEMPISLSVSMIYHLISNLISSNLYSVFSSNQCSTYLTYLKVT